MASIFSKEFWTRKPAVEEKPKQPARGGGFGASMFPVESGVARSTIVIGYDGEKHMGEVGPPKAYYLDYNTLRVRTRQAYIESETAATVVNKRTRWIVGDGLKLQCEPRVKVLEMFGVNLNKEKFNEQVEAFMDVYASSKMADYAGVRTLTQLLEEASDERQNAGDMLVILRAVDGVVKVQHIDASWVSNPLNLTLRENKDRAGFDYYSEYGNRVRNGVEIDAKGEPVAYHVKTGAAGQHERILARGPRSGMLMAYMIYDRRFGIGATRGLGRLAGSIETVKKIDDYVGATLKTAVERAKNIMFFVHDKESTQADPMEGARVLASAGNAGAEVETGIPVTSDGVPKLTSVVVSENATIHDLPKGVEPKALETKQELVFPEFTGFLLDMVGGATDIPAQVMLGKYDSSFSSGRLGGKDFEQGFKKDRANLASQYLDPIFALQLYLLVLNNVVDAMPYVQAVAQGNEVVMNAFLSCRWVGCNFPDIDPLKTANYLRKMLGDDLANAPLMTLEAAAEAAEQGDYSAIIEQVGKEKKKVLESGIEPVNHGGAKEQGTTTEERNVPDPGSGS